jgi:hypothetical protein
MKIPVITKLVEKYSIEELQAAEEALAEEKIPEIDIDGEDEGEKLTHAFAALWIKEKVNEGIEFKAVLRECTNKVRESIS